MYNNVEFHSCKQIPFRSNAYIIKTLMCTSVKMCLFENNLKIIVVDDEVKCEVD